MLRSRQRRRALPLPWQRRRSPRAAAALLGRLMSSLSVRAPWRGLACGRAWPQWADFASEGQRPKAAKRGAKHQVQLPLALLVPAPSLEEPEILALSERQSRKRFLLNQFALRHAYHGGRCCATGAIRAPGHGATLMSYTACVTVSLRGVKEHPSRSSAGLCSLRVQAEAARGWLNGTGGWFRCAGSGVPCLALRPSTAAPIAFPVNSPGRGPCCFVRRP